MMKKVLITGGASGIGEATAKLFKNNGYDVYITYNETKSNLDGVTKIKCDLSKMSDIENLFKEIKSVDILVNNAGVALIKMINDTTEIDYDYVSAINQKSVYFTSKLAALEMIKKHSGSIINVSSIWGECGASCETLYSMTKGAVIAFTKALSKELAPSNITVNCVCPGIIDTKMNSMFDKNELISEVPLSRLGSPEEVASAILFLAENTYITGQILGVNGGM